MLNYSKYAGHIPAYVSITNEKFSLLISTSLPNGQIIKNVKRWLIMPNYCKYAVHMRAYILITGFLSGGFPFFQLPSLLVRFKTLNCFHWLSVTFNEKLSQICSSYPGLCLNNQWEVFSIKYFSLSTSLPIGQIALIDFLWLSIRNYFKYAVHIPAFVSIT